jgi:hypothetical protein
MKNALLFFITLATVLPMHDTLWATVPQSIAGRRGTLLCSALLCYASTLPPPPPPLCCDSAGLPCALRMACGGQLWQQQAASSKQQAASSKQQAASTWGKKTNR